MIAVPVADRVYGSGGIYSEQEILRAARGWRIGPLQRWRLLYNGLRLGRLFISTERAYDNFMPTIHWTRAALWTQRPSAGVPWWRPRWIAVTITVWPRRIIVRWYTYAAAAEEDTEDIDRLQAHYLSAGSAHLRARGVARHGWFLRRFGTARP